MTKERIILLVASGVFAGLAYLTRSDAAVSTLLLSFASGAGLGWGALRRPGDKP